MSLKELNDTDRINFLDAIFYPIFPMNEAERSYLMFNLAANLTLTTNMRECIDSMIEDTKKNSNITKRENLSRVD